MRLQSFRERLVVVLLAALPLHALFVTVATRIIAGPDHAPMGMIVVWKETLLGVILLLAILEIARVILSSDEGRHGMSWFDRAHHGILRRFDLLDALIIALFLLSIGVQIFNFQFSIFNSSFIFGLKYDFLPLIAFLILRRVPWSAGFQKRVMQVLLWIGGIVAAYGIITFFLPATFFHALGYSDLHSLYVPGGPLAAFQQIGGTTIRRIQSTMSGPNQFGLYLLIPWSIVAMSMLDTITGKTFYVLVRRMLTGWILVGLFNMAIVLTFSRAAWVGAVVVLIFTLARKNFPPLRETRGRVREGVLSLLLFMIVVLSTISFFFPSIILRLASSRDHLRRPLEAVQVMLNHPFGLGLGTAGPASNRTSDACVFLPAPRSLGERGEGGSDTSWAVDRSNLCVFVGDHQVQPIDRACTCPLLPENWYLQIGVELGIAGFLLFIAFTFLIIKRLMFNFQLSIFHSAAAASFIAVAVAALFLHAWEDTAVALTVWTLLSTVLPGHSAQRPTSYQSDVFSRRWR